MTTDKCSSRERMLSTERLLGRYSLVASDLEDDLDGETSSHKVIWYKLIFSRCLVLFFILLSLICLAMGFTSGILLNRQITSATSLKFTAASFCNDSQFRREWRSLGHCEKHKHIQAVQCLKKVPSRLGQNQSLYDDFPYVHFRIGGYCTLCPMFDYRC